MKKISLKTVKNSMKRDEMRSVKGGSGWENCPYSSPSCNWKGRSFLNTRADFTCCSW